MAGPQFATPHPVYSSRPRRRFTLAEANKALPLVKLIVSDIVRCHDQAAGLQMKLATTTSRHEQHEAQKELEYILEHLQGYVDELSELGCELRDYQTGLIDFVGRHRDHDVSLCWKLGEDSIHYWHEIESGFSGRQPVSTLEEGQ